jgi:hypothetical protein
LGLGGSECDRQQAMGGLLLAEILLPETVGLEASLLYRKDKGQDYEKRCDQPVRKAIYWF